MSWYTIFYLFSVADKLSVFLTTIAVISAIVLFLTLVFQYTSYDQDASPEVIKLRKWLLGIGLFAALLVVITPSRKDLLLIIAGGAVGQFVTTDNNAKAIPADLTRFLRGQIQSATAELKENMLMDGEREKLEGLTKDQVVDMLMKEKAKALPDTLQP